MYLPLSTQNRTLIRKKRRNKQCGLTSNANSIGSIYKKPLKKQRNLLRSNYNSVSLFIYNVSNISNSFYISVLNCLFSSLISNISIFSCFCFFLILTLFFLCRTQVDNC